MPNQEESRNQRTHWCLNTLGKEQNRPQDLDNIENSNLCNRSSFVSVRGGTAAALYVTN